MILGKLKRLGFLFLIGVLFINFVQAGDICTIKITANSNPELIPIPWQESPEKDGPKTSYSATADVEVSDGCTLPVKIKGNDKYAGGFWKKCESIVGPGNSKLECKYETPNHYETLPPNGYGWQQNVLKFEAGDECESVSVAALGCKFIDDPEGINKQECERVLESYGHTSSSQIPNEEDRKWYSEPFLTPENSLLDYKIEMDSEYVEKIRKERGFTPNINSLSPFDNFAVVATFKVCPPTDNDAQRFKAILMTQDSFGMALVVATSEFKWQDKEINGETITKDEINYGRKGTYRAVFQGYKGDYDSKKLEGLIASIANNRPVWIRILAYNQDGTSINLDNLAKDVPIKMTNCVQVYGGGKHGLVFARLDSLDPSLAPYIAPIYLINAANALRAEGIERTDPFKKYKNEFSYYADISNRFRGSDIINPNFRKIVSCQGKTYVVYNKDKPLLYSFGGGFVSRANNFIFIYPDASYPPYNHSQLIMHEMGHAFCGLADEYRLGYVSSISPERLKLTTKSNCASDPLTRYRGNDNKIYGKTSLPGCGYLSFSNGIRKTDNLEIYRPSESSLMGSFWKDDVVKRPTKFNAVSCGYCLASIKGGNAKDYYPECARMDTIDGKNYI